MLSGLTTEQALMTITTTALLPNDTCVYAERADYGEPHKLEPMTCINCGGRIDIEDLTCCFCGTHYR